MTLLRQAPGGEAEDGPGHVFLLQTNIAFYVKKCTGLSYGEESTLQISIHENISLSMHLSGLKKRRR